MYKMILLKFYAYKHGAHDRIDNCQACLNKQFYFNENKLQMKCMFEEEKKNN